MGEETEKNHQLTHHMLTLTEAVIFVLYLNSRRIMKKRSHGGKHRKKEKELKLGEYQHDLRDKNRNEQPEPPPGINTNTGGGFITSVSRNKPETTAAGTHTPHTREGGHRLLRLFRAAF